jgi:hypothetical protein
MNIKEEKFYITDQTPNTYYFSLNKEKVIILENSSTEGQSLLFIDLKKAKYKQLIFWIMYNIDINWIDNYIVDIIFTDPNNIGNDLYESFLTEEGFELKNNIVDVRNL